MQFVIPFLLGLSWLANAAYIPALSTNTSEIESRDVGGYRSVAYYVNWVSSDHAYMCITYVYIHMSIYHWTKPGIWKTSLSKHTKKEVTLISDCSGHLRS